MKDRDWSLHDLLRSLGLNRTYTGYQYLIYILELVRKEPERLEQVTKQIYPDVAREFGVKTGSVDSALRTTAKVCWEAGAEAWCGRQDGRDRPPTVSVFLRQLAREDRRRRETGGYKP